MIMDRLWTAALLFAWGGLASAVAVDPAARAYDDYLRERPWITAGVELVPAPEFPLIRYDVHADLPVSGRWRAWLDADGVRRCFGSGFGDYSPDTPRQAVWTWGDWLGVQCPVPERPFRACVSYAVRTPRGATGEFGPYCSEVYDPRGRG